MIKNPYSLSYYSFEFWPNIIEFVQEGIYFFIWYFKMHNSALTMLPIHLRVGDSIWVLSMKLQKQITKEIWKFEFVSNISSPFWQLKHNEIVIFSTEILLVTIKREVEEQLWASKYNLREADIC